MNETKDTIKAVILGHAVGDALGVPVEFWSREEIDLLPVMGMRGFGTFPVPAGAWSDDTSMTLCALDALGSGSIDYDLIMSNFAKWYYRGEYTPTGMTFDMGRTCSAAIERYVSGTPAGECGLSGEYDNGNGSLMRMLPFALMMHYCTEYAQRDPREKLAVIHSASALTHAHERAQIGCGIYSLVLWELLCDPCKASIGRGLDTARLIYGDRKEFGAYSRIFDEGFAELPMEEIRSSGYVVDTLEAALWCLLRADRYDWCVLRAVNLGEDTDTVAAVAGGLAGAMFGLKAVQDSLADRLLRRDYIESLCDKAAEAWAA